ncbi:MAG: DUF2937 family protein [Alphaproteobacteria bacterium]|nr:DUF2937 family protein [Alphaproteobacteria bacterium]
MSAVRDLVFLLFVLGGAVLGSQIPNFADAYAQRLGGALDEARRTLGEFERAAARADLSFADYRFRLHDSDDGAVRATAQAVDGVVARVEQLAALQGALAVAGPWKRPVVIALDHDRAILENAYAQWTPNLTLDPRWGAIGLAVGWLLHAAVSGLIGLASRGQRGRRRVG